MLNQPIADHQLLVSLFNAGVDAVGGEQAVANALSAQPLRATGAIYAVAVGKAADAMLQGLLQHEQAALASALLITKYGHVSDAMHADERVQVIEASHPVPDTNSLRAGDELVAYLQHIPAEATLVFMVSGGASSLVEKLPGTMDLADLRRMTDQLLADGLDIGQMNRVRKTMSLIKGGRLARWCSGCRVVQLLISDVPSDEPATIGSGLLIPACEQELTEDLLPSAYLPSWANQWHSLDNVPPPAEAPVWAQIETSIVASNQLALDAIASAVHSLDIELQLAAGRLTGDACQMARDIAALLSRDDTNPGIYLWGGETTMQLPDLPGRGGRNQHLSLSIARQMSIYQSDGAGWTVLCCGTDGTDGPTGDAGGIVDHEMVWRGDMLNLDIDHSLSVADSGSYLAAVDALVTTGPTGTNVMDVVIALKH